jgi:hypothetical protein
MPESRSKRAWDSFERICLHPMFATVVTLLMIVAGGMGSIWSEDIRKAFPFTLAPKWKNSQAAWAFWCVAIVASLLFFFRQRAVDRAQAKGQREIVQQAAELANLIRTLPPTNFLSVFSQLYNSASKAVETVLGKPQLTCDKPTVEQVIRQILRVLAILAQKFDGDDPMTHYAANIMIFRVASEIADEEEEAILHRMKFHDDGAAIANLKGILELLPSLSTVAADQTASPDLQVASIILPVPKIGRHGDLVCALPGAPLAFIDKEPSIHVSTDQLAKWCEDNGDFTVHLRQQVATYFQSPEARMVRSFISIPLFLSGDAGEDDKSRDAVAVLNIHCNRENLLNIENDQSGREPVSHFIDIIRPLQVLLVQVLSVMPGDSPGATNCVSAGDSVSGMNSAC